MHRPDRLAASALATLCLALPGALIAQPDAALASTVETLLSHPAGTHPADETAVRTATIEDCRLSLRHTSRKPESFTVFQTVALATLDTAQAEVRHEDGYSPALIPLSGQHEAWTTFSTEHATDKQRRYMAQVLKTPCERGACSATVPLGGFIEFALWGDDAPADMERVLSNLGQLAATCQKDI
ncbi:hypothetical protein P279_25735 [Rhodobacteraceae bacterium PD-2]|nr:hypothetical protein P279_25735 [Rhodobacteraceae bacterium PD-2]